MLDYTLSLTTKFINDIAASVKQVFKEEDLDTIRNTHGLNKDAPECCKSSSSIYILYNAKMR